MDASTNHFFAIILFLASAVMTMLAKDDLTHCHYTPVMGYFFVALVCFVAGLFLWSP